MLFLHDIDFQENTIRSAQINDLVKALCTNTSRFLSFFCIRLLQCKSHRIRWYFQMSPREAVSQNRFRIGHVNRCIWYITHQFFSELSIWTWLELCPFISYLFCPKDIQLCTVWLLIDLKLDSGYYIIQL